VQHVPIKNCNCQSISKNRGAAKPASAVIALGPCGLLPCTACVREIAKNRRGREAGLRRDRPGACAGYSPAPPASETGRVQPTLAGRVLARVSVARRHSSHQRHIGDGHLLCYSLGHRRGLPEVAMECIALPSPPSLHEGCVSELRVQRRCSSYAQRVGAHILR